MRQKLGNTVILYSGQLVPVDYFRAINGMEGEILDPKSLAQKNYGPKKSLGGGELDICWVQSLRYRRILSN